MNGNRDSVHLNANLNTKTKATNLTMCLINLSSTSKMLNEKENKHCHESDCGVENTGDPL